MSQIFVVVTAMSASNGVRIACSTKHGYPNFPISCKIFNSRSVEIFIKILYLCGSRAVHEDNNGPTNGELVNCAMY